MVIFAVHLSAYKMEKENLSKEKFSILLQDAVQDLLYPSESDEALLPFHWDLEGMEKPDPKTVLQQLALPEKTKIIEQKAHDFFEKVTLVEDWYEEEEKTKVEKFKTLQKTMENNLKDVQVFLIGKKEIAVYVLGKFPAGGFAGFSTKIIQT